MRAYRLIILFLLLVGTLTAAGQQAEPLLSQYYEVTPFYNPGAAGRSDLINVRAGGRLQWVGIDNAPVSVIGSADMPFKLGSRRLATGIALQHESYGLYRNMTLGAMIAYKLRLAGGTLSPGLRIGILNQSFRGSEVYIPDDDNFHTPSDDGIPTTDVGSNAVDIGLGLNYERRGFTAGLSLLHANSPTVRFSAEGTGASASASSEVKNYEFPVSPTLYFTAGGNIPIKYTLFEIMPSAMIATDFSDFAGVATMRMRYNKLFSAGLGYRYRQGVILSLGMELKQFFVGYTYEYPLGSISSATSGSHELLAGYAFKLDLSDKNKHKHKSIRIL